MKHSLLFYLRNLEYKQVFNVYSFFTRGKSLSDNAYKVLLVTAEKILIVKAVVVFLPCQYDTIPVAKIYFPVTFFSCPPLDVVCSKLSLKFHSCECSGYILRGKSVQTSSTVLKNALCFYFLTL